MIYRLYKAKDPHISGRMLHLRFVSLFQGPHDDSGVVTAGRPLEVSLSSQAVTWPQTVCPPWTRRCGPGAVAPRVSWDTEISSPGLVPLKCLKDNICTFSWNVWNTHILYTVHINQKQSQSVQLFEICISRNVKCYMICVCLCLCVRACVRRLQPLCIKSLSGEEVIKVAAGSHHSLALTAQCQVTKMFLKKKKTHLPFFCAFFFFSKNMCY